ncbi:hypothetical protein [Stenotrophomonas maltophilia]|uniref:hypothetical protein n=1 Tax=Stenotrophomonas maltophilia TaxID=40324 RepID=UPI001CEDBAE1|nr:hypothetical protein [Stenotrophomonas maltophilia]
MQELLEMARMSARSDKAMVAMLDLYERNPAAVSTLLISAMKAPVERNGMLRAAAELLPDDSAAEVCRFAWSEFKNGSRHWLVAEIAAQAAYRVPGLLHDDWDAVLRLSAQEPVEGPFWWELPIEVGRRWIQEARGASASAAGLPGLPLEMSGVVEFQDAARDLSGSRDGPWAAIGREGLSGLELGSGRALHGGRGLHLRFSAKHQRLQLAQSTRVERRLQRLHPTWKDGNAQATGHIGGRLEGRCGICNSPLQRLLELELALIGPCTLSKVTLGICLDCPDNGESGWCHGDPVYFRHDRLGLPSAHESQVFDPRACPETSTNLIEAEVDLVELRGRFWQPPNYVGGWQNYSRVGGLPSWIQSGLYLTCPDCCRTMFFVMQLDSHIPLDDGSLMQWMNGGMLYTFWCDQCRISGHYSQYS